MAILIGLLALIIGIILYKYIVLRSEMSELSDYIDKALDGNLEITEFDEKELSKINIPRPSRGFFSCGPKGLYY